MDVRSNTRKSVLTALRQTMLFSIGSALILREKAKEFAEQAITRGQEIEDEGKTLVQEMRAEKRHKQPERIDALEVRIRNALKRLNVPTQKDVDQLNRHVNTLSNQVDELISAR
jgi:polyhydroxyalkanoate synthesis regulator phasin